MPDIVGYDRNTKISRRLSKEMEKKFHAAKDKVQHGQAYRQHKREQAWRKSLSQYDNNVGFDFTSTQEMDLVNVNISFSTINTLVPYVSDENPRFIIHPGSGDATPENGSVLEVMMNNIWRDPDVEGQVYVTDAVWDYLVFGDGYISVIWEPYEDPQYSGAGDLLEGRGIDKIKYGVERVSPWDVWIDPYSDGIHNARWLCRRIMVPVVDLEDDERYKLLDSVEGGRGGVRDDADPDTFERLQYTHAEKGWVGIYEYYDLQKDWMMTFTMDSEHPIRFVEGIKCPIIQLANYRISNSPYHIGELEMIYSLQMEINRTRSEMITHRRRNTAKWIARKDMLSPEAQTAMTSNVINDIIWVEGNAPFASYLEQVAPQALTADAYNQDGIIRNDINEITGVNEYLRGQPQDISRTATEASIIEGATNVRTRHKLNQVETFLRRIGQQLLNTIQATLPETEFEEMTMYVTGADAEKLLLMNGMEGNQDVIVQPTPEMFGGRYIVDVERGTAELRNPQAQAAKYKEMFQIVLSSLPMLMQVGVNVNPQRILELWLKAANVEDIDSIIQSDEDMMLMQQIAQQQAAMGAQPQGQGDLASGSATPAGQPREQSTMAPEAMIDPSNSGMLPART